MSCQLTADALRRLLFQRRLLGAACVICRQSSSRCDYVPFAAIQDTLAALSKHIIWSLQPAARFVTTRQALSILDAVLLCLAFLIGAKTADARFRSATAAQETQEIDSGESPQPGSISEKLLDSRYPDELDLIRQRHSGHTSGSQTMSQRTRHRVYQTVLDTAW
ncbi:hypothetical protein WJX73_007362 [Symbiochloris irregularis]|uniref:Uncharacterized protein n=1 Tax=Symbiochloris irregularis TaxID=706552 RepID=A0AAW1PR72_9CHLO